MKLVELYLDLYSFFEISVVSFEIFVRFDYLIRKYRDYSFLKGTFRAYIT